MIARCARPQNRMVGPMSVGRTSLLLFALLLAPLWAEARPERVTIQLPWKHQFEFAGYYAAIEQGFYAQRGLEVELREYHEGIDVVAEVLAGRADFGVTDTSVIQARLEGAPVIMLANYFKRMPLVILARPGIKRVADLLGRRLMISTKDLRSPLMRLAFEVEGLRPGQDFTVIPHSFNAEPLLSGEVDAMAAFYSNEPFYLERKGFDYNLIDLSSYLRSTGDVYFFTSKARAEQDPILVRNLIEATSEGWRYALAHKEEMVDLILRQWSQRKEREALLFEAKRTHDLIRPMPLPVGAVYAEAVEEVAALIRRQQGLIDRGELRGFFFDERSARVGTLDLSESERAWLASHPTLRYCFNPLWAPFDYLEGGEHRGVFRDYLDLFSARLGVAFEAVPTLESDHATNLWVKTLEYARERRCDFISGAVRTPERETYLSFTNPYFQVTQVLIARSDKPFVSGIEAIQDQPIGTLIGAAITSTLRRDFPRMRLMEMEENQAADALERGEIYAFVVALEHSARFLNERLPNFKVIGKLDYPYPISVAVRNDWPELLASMDKAARSITQAEHNEIHRRWTRHTLTEQVDYRLLWQVVGGGLLIVAMMLYWNRKLARAHTALRVSEERYANLTRLIPVGTYATHATGPHLDGIRFDYISPKLFELLGMPPPADGGRGIHTEALLARIHPDDRQGLIEAILATIRDPQPLRWEGRGVIDGEQRYFRLEESAPDPRPDGGIYSRGVLIDITDRKRAEDKLRQLALAIEQSPTTIVITDLEGHITYANPKFEETTGYSIAEAIGQNPRILKSGHTTGREYVELWETIQSGGIWRGEFHNKRKNGTQYWEHATIAPILDEKNRPTSFLAIKEDITERKRVEAALTEAKAAAEAASVAKSRFLATMSHELRTPMNGILGMAQLLLSDPPSAAQIQNYAHTILHAGQSLLTLLNDILDLSKIEAGKLELDAGIVAPAEILWETEILFGGMARAKGLKLSARWQGPGEPRYLGDSHRLRQMLTNLVNNAIKFTAQGEVCIEARVVETQGVDTLLEFAVRDTGIGIAADQQALLFQPFSQLDNSTTRQFGGTGLGLSIVRSLAQAMGGEVGVESVPGQGSRFWFRVLLELPPDAGDSRAPPRTASPPAESARSPHLTGRVLIAEDNTVNQMIVETMLRNRGLATRTVENGQRAVEAVITEADPIDAILMDLQMPVLDGYAATARIRAWEQAQRRPRLPIIALTADAFPEDRARCLNAGMDDYLAKPVAMADLVAALAKWLPVAETDPPEIPAPETPPRPLDWPAVRDRIQALLPLLEQGKFDALDRFAELEARVTGTTLADPLAAIRSDVQAFRFEQARDALARLAATPPAPGALA